MGPLVGIDGLTSVGYGIEDYVAMFGLTEAQLAMAILDCRAGACSFACEMVAKGHHVVATDPLYQNDVKSIEHRVDHALKDLEDRYTKSPDDFVLDESAFNQFLTQKKRNAQQFLNDFTQGKEEGRYMDCALPALPFEDEQFNLALVSHFLFTFSESLGVQAHVDAIEELTRVANEVRIFPLVCLEGGLSLHVGHAVSQLQSRGFGVEIRGVPFEWQKDGNAMLRVWAPSCSVDKHA